ncbi:MAG: ABC transporter ATP-binding protein [Micromonosporaceae bacterium]|nr:ABC transporter ATP-binding protein [Micromonosporaceae bacterium]
MNGLTTSTHPHRPPALRVENLHTVYRNGAQETSVVRGVSFDVHSGEIVGLVGESGSGKSTVLKSLLDLIGENGQARADVLEVAGQDVRSLPRAEYRRMRGVELAFISQDPANAFNPAWTIGSQFRRVLKRHFPGMSRRELDAWAVELLGAVGIDGRGKLDSYPFQFSQGQLQRIMIALACASERLQVLLADEPTTSLDVTIEAQVLQLIRRLRDERGLAVVLVTHNLAVVAEMCDRVLVMYAGRIVEDAPVRDLFRNPQHPYTRQLLKSIPAFPRDGRRLHTMTGAVPDLSIDVAGCAFAPRCEERISGLCDTIRPVLPPRTERATARAACHVVSGAVPAASGGEGDG